MDRETAAVAIAIYEVNIHSLFVVFSIHNTFNSYITRMDKHWKIECYVTCTLSSEGAEEQSKWKRKIFTSV